MKLAKKRELAQKRRWRVRKKIRGTADRPRLTICFTNQHAYAQCIDDQKGHTLVSLSSLSKDASEKGLKPNVEGAKLLGAEIAKAAKAKGIEKVVFDRAGRLYHGCVRAFAESARENGLQF